MISTASFDVSDEIASIGETLATITLEFLFACMDRLMPFDGRFLGERLATDAATERFLALKFEVVLVRI